ncbi:antibiotic biosynthesis monooxygenase family protein [Stutzerimonas azotifigens]|uniref:antibiotic biosynthesis monooxygenase family protein n=1 Tax=Stutzerimonas azotifigens TaxID=291995 RepID=UPI001F3FE01A|nr:antibiotic biosynthesis monooxygenase [Stutzerimonas azotifigens]
MLWRHQAQGRDGQMHVVIFRARARALDEAYLETAAQLRQLALDSFNCIAFEAVTEGDREIALSYWHDEDDIRRWKRQADHLAAQRLGAARWYVHYSVEVARIERSYRSDERVAVGPGQGEP